MINAHAHENHIDLVSAQCPFRSNPRRCGGSGLGVDQTSAGRCLPEADVNLSLPCFLLSSSSSSSAQRAGPRGAVGPGAARSAVAESRCATAPASRRTACARAWSRRAAPATLSLASVSAGLHCRPLAVAVVTQQCWNWPRSDSLICNSLSLPFSLSLSLSLSLSQVKRAA